MAKVDMLGTGDIRLRIALKDPWGKSRGESSPLNLKCGLGCQVVRDHYPKNSLRLFWEIARKA